MACTIWNHKKRPLRYHMGMCKSMPLPYLDEDGGTTATRRLSWCFMLKYAFHWWTGQRIHNNLIVVERYLWLMQDKMIQNLVEPRLELFYPPYVAGIDLPHQDVVDSYNLTLLPEPMPYCYLNPCEQISVKFEIRCKFFLQENAHESNLRIFVFVYIITYYLGNWSLWISDDVQNASLR